MASSGPARRANPALYGGVPPVPGPAGMAPRLLEFADELRREGVAVGTSELLDAFHALDAVSWTAQEDFREALAATLAKSQEDRHVLDVLVELAGALAARPPGRVVLSGLRTEDGAEALAVYAALGYREAARIAEAGWLTLRLERR